MNVWRSKKIVRRREGEESGDGYRIWKSLRIKENV